jgi:microcystin-dependent protein
MLILIGELNGQKIEIPVTADTGTGAPVGSYLMLEKKSNPQGYLYCDGSTFDSTAYPALYQYLGSNVLPDFREFSPVGAEQNTTNVYDASTNPSGVIHDHDVYTEGQAKDDQLQSHTHEVENAITYGTNAMAGTTLGVLANSIISDRDATTIKSGRKGTVTRGKRKAVFVYIKATSGLTENQQENVLNTINENLSYSTTEHKTGRYWIDGKPTYEKTIVLSNLVVGENVVNISDFRVLINYYGYCYISSFGWSRPFPWMDGAGRCNITRYNNTGVIIYTDSVITDLAVHLEYTKTTD